MTYARTVWLAPALLCAALFAGCGSSGSTTTSTSSSTPTVATQTSATTATQTTTTTPTTSTPTTSTPSATVPSAGSISQLAASVCKSTADRATLPAALKAKVEAICNNAANGHQAQAEAMARKLCTEEIEKIPGPNSAAKEKALKECATAK